jgi:predicted dehydrogenase
MNSDVKVAVIGAGNWGKNLVKTFHALGALGYVADSDSKRRKELEDAYPGIQVISDYTQIWKTPSQAVAIATIAESHFHIAKEALKAGKDVFVEKPMTLRTNDAQELVELARASEKILMVGHLLLYQPAITWIKDYIQSGELGKIHSLHQSRLNLGRVRSVENVLWSFGVHDIAVLLYLTGEEPSRLSVSGQRALQDGIEDDVYAHMEFPSGKQAHLHSSWLWPNRSRELTVIGSRGMLTYDEIAQKVTLHKRTVSPNLQVVDEGSQTVYEGPGEPLKIELEEFLKCVSTRKRPLSDATNGLSVVKLLEQLSELMKVKHGR